MSKWLANVEKSARPISKNLVDWEAWELYLAKHRHSFQYQHNNCQVQERWISAAMALSPDFIYILYRGLGLAQKSVACKPAP